MSQNLGNTLQKYLWLGIILLSVSQMLKPTMNALSLFQLGGEIGWSFVGFMKAIPIMVIGLIVADTMRPINAFRAWPGKLLIALGIGLIILDAVSSLSLYLMSAKFSPDQLDFSNAQSMVRKQKWLPFNIVTKACLYVFICFVGLFKKPEKNISVKEVFE